MKKLSNQQLNEFSEILSEIINAKKKEEKKLRVKFINKAMKYNLIEFNSVEDLKKSHEELYEEASDVVFEIALNNVFKGITSGLRKALDKCD